MRTIKSKTVLAAVAALLVGCGSSPQPECAKCAQSPQASALGQVPGKPDFSGFWRNKNFAPGVLKAGIIPFTPPYEEKIREVNRIAAAGGDVPTVSKRCLPFGMPHGMKFLSEILFGSTHALLLYNGGVRHVWLDGRQHTPDNELFDSLDGESIGHWEGDTFVISTRGIQENEITLGVPVPGMSVIERLRLSDRDTLEIATTITAPGALQQPWSFTREYARSSSSTDIGNSRSCDPTADRSIDPKTGKQRFDLTPPEGGFTPPGA